MAGHFVKQGLRGAIGCGHADHQAPEGHMIGGIFRPSLDRLARQAVVKAIPLLPLERRRTLERHLRGIEEFHKLHLANCVIVSFGKSGRTWLRVMLSRFYQLRHRLPENSLIGFINLHLRNHRIPKLFFTHDNYLRDYTGNRHSKADFYEKDVILLVRHPCDVAVSQYFQWRYRMHPRKKTLNDYPEHDATISIFDFVFRHEAGLRKVVQFLNDWARELPRLSNLLLVRYEDIQAAPEASLRRVLAFIGHEPTEDELRDAVAFASVENMRKLEQPKFLWWTRNRLGATDKSNPDSHKVRRAKVGGFRDYFDDEQVAQIDDFIRANLLPGFGYRPDEVVSSEKGDPIRVTPTA